MSVFNCESYLEKSISSILDQTFKNFEFIIIDDGSTDGSLKVIKSFSDKRIRFMTQENAGLSASLNRGIRQAKSSLIARMDADDISHPDRLRKQVNFMEANPQCVCLGTNAIVIDMNGLELFTSELPISWQEIKKLLPTSPFFHSSTMIRKEVLLKCGGYNEEIKHHFEDIILWNQMAEIGELWNIKEPLLSYRLLPSSITNRSVSDSKKMTSIAIKIVQGISLADKDKVFLQRINLKKAKNVKKSNYFLAIGKIYLEKKVIKRCAFSNLLRSIIWNPLNYKAWFNLLLSLQPTFLIHKWKKYRAIN